MERGALWSPDLPWTCEHTWGAGPLFPEDSFAFLHSAFLRAQGWKVDHCVISKVPDRHRRHLWHISPKTTQGRKGRPRILIS